MATRRKSREELERLLDRVRVAREVEVTRGNG